MKKTKFYEFTQNNSGGYFDVDENVCGCVIIEAFNKKQALELFIPMIKNQSKSCACCGDRWNVENFETISLGKYKKIGYGVGVYSIYTDAEKRWFDLYGEFSIIETPSWKTIYGVEEFHGRIYFKTIDEYCRLRAKDHMRTNPDIRVHFLDGTKREFFNEKHKEYQYE